MDRKSFIRISPDSDVLYIDSDSCCVMAYGNEICNEGPSLGPRFSIVVPGIEEWVKRYEYATVFVGTVTSPSFDWITWHYEGLCFAKAIWKQMPRCYEHYEPPFDGLVYRLTLNMYTSENVKPIVVRYLHRVCSFY